MDAKTATSKETMCVNTHPMICLAICCGWTPRCSLLFARKSLSDTAEPALECLRRNGSEDVSRHFCSGFEKKV